MRRAFSMVAAAIAMAGVVGTTANAAHFKDGVMAIHNVKKPVADIGRFMGSGTPNPRKHIITPKGNQRQLRKYLRQNPHMRRKYKK